MTSPSWRDRPGLAHVLPLFVFLGFVELARRLSVDNSLLPWYRQAELWLYPLQCLVCGVLLVLCWRNYDFSLKRGFGFATLMALLGIAVWIAPTAIFDALGWEEKTTPAWLRYLGFQEREDSGFNPDIFRDVPWAYWSAIFMRFLRAVVIVAFVEEIFWRGFLMRYLYDWDGDFWKAPIGAWRWWTVAVTVVLFTLIHQPTDYFAAVIYGTLACWVAIKTKSLAACVWMHAVANFVLCVYVMLSGNRGLW